MAVSLAPICLSFEINKRATSRRQETDWMAVGVITDWLLITCEWAGTLLYSERLSGSGRRQNFFSPSPTPTGFVCACRILISLNGPSEHVTVSLPSLSTLLLLLPQPIDPPAVESCSLVTKGRFIVLDCIHFQQSEKVFLLLFVRRNYNKLFYGQNICIMDAIY